MVNVEQPVKDEGILCGILDKHGTAVIEIIPASFDNPPQRELSGVIHKLTIKCQDCGKILYSAEWDMEEEVGEMETGSFVGMFTIESCYDIYRIARENLKIQLTQEL